MNMNMNIEKPLKYKNWLIWKNTVLTSLDLSDCNDAVKGVCLKNKSIYECMDECDEKKCGVGTYIETMDGKTICIPVYTEITKKLNPILRLRTKNIYDLKNVKNIFTYINANIYPFPPDIANIVYYNDILTIVQSSTNNSIGTRTSDFKENSLIFFEKNFDINIQINNKEKNFQLSDYNLPVIYGDNIIFSIPATNLKIMSDNNFQDNLVLKSALNLISEPLIVNFSLYPLNNNKKIGDIVTYDDKFNIRYDNGIVKIKENTNNLILAYKAVDSVFNDDKAIFNFVSKMNGYYCENNICKSVPIKDITPNGYGGKYKNKTVFINQACSGICNFENDTMFKNNLSQNLSSNLSSKIFVIILIIILVIILVIIMIKKYFNFQHV